MTEVAGPTNASSSGGFGLGQNGIGRVAAPLREQVVTLIRQAILDFRLKPGQRLVERELIEQLGVSRTTIREVLRQLTTEGLVTVIPQKGAIVTAPSPEEAADIYEMRAALEALAVRRFVERATAEEVAKLRAAYQGMEKVLDSDGDIHAHLTAKDNFYGVLLASSPSIEQVLGGLQARVRLLRATSLGAPGRRAEAVAEIGTLMDAIEARDADRAAEACVQHVRRAASTGLARLAEGEDLDPASLAEG
ncbi:MAG: GntR family transcriptional regulator [Acidimicrobiaceae bacterium]|nr:GntR family transcriptional regulator [Acidimicrobiaceae bacterium]